MSVTAYQLKVLFREEMLTASQACSERHWRAPQGSVSCALRNERFFLPRPLLVKLGPPQETGPFGPANAFRNESCWLGMGMILLIDLQEDCLQLPASLFRSFPNTVRYLREKFGPHEPAVLPLLS
jgi:hypothetical protein